MQEHSPIERHVVPKGITNVRLSEYALGKLKYLPSRQGLKKAIKSGRLLVDQQVAQTGTWISEGQVLELIELKRSVQKNFPLNCKVYYEDDEIAVVWKPAGYPTSGNYFKTFENALPHNLKESKSQDFLPQPRPVHRLDTPTSGLIIVAKTVKARVRLGQMLEDKLIDKYYYAITKGGILDDSGSINTAIDGKYAHSEFKVLQRTNALKWGYISLLSLKAVTGRTHQLRIHLQSIGHPIIGDKRYDKEDTIVHKGLFLCAYRLNFLHPITQEEISIDAPIPEKFKSFIDREERRYRLANQ